MLWLIVCLAGLLWAPPSAAAQSPAVPDVVMQFAPASTDIIFRAHIDELTQTLEGLKPLPPARDALKRLQELRSGLGMQGAEQLDIAVVYTFHIVGTDAQLVVLELRGPPPARFRQVPKALRSQLAVVERCGHHFVLWSKAKNLAAASAKAVGSCTEPRMAQLPESLQQGVRELKAQSFWATLVLTEARRQLIHEISGSPAAKPEAQVRLLRHISMVVSELKSDRLTLELLLEYPSAQDIDAFRRNFASSVPFPDDGRTIQQEGSRIRVTQRNLSFADLNEFLSRF